jgi:hypothetical protein
MDVCRENTDVSWVGFHPLVYLSLPATSKLIYNMRVCAGAYSIEGASAWFISKYKT